jgi:hypothetical protein
MLRGLIEMMIKLMNESRAKHLKRILHEIYIMPIKNWIWNNIIDKKHGWHEYIQEGIDEIDIDQLMADRAEEYQQGISDTYD